MTHEEIILRYTDKALAKLKIAHNFSVNYFGICIPKNAVYGRVTKNLFVYITDFSQFYAGNGKTRFSVYVLDQRKDGHFVKTIVSKHTEWYNMIYAFIAYHDHFGAKVEYQYCMNRISKPELHTAPKPMYRGNPRQLLSENAANYGRGITETDAVSRMYIPNDRRDAQRIIEKQRSYDKYRRF